MNNHSEHIDDLIAKYFLDEASADEKQQVESWAKLSEENQKYFEQMKALFQHTKTLKDLPAFNADAAWEKVKPQITTQRSAKIIPLKTGYTQYLRIAAVIIAVLFISVFTFRYFNNATETTTLYASNTLVVDTLQGGTVVHLNKHSRLVSSYNKSKKQHEVVLTGEAYFDIHKEHEDETFIVSTQGLFIKDIGTSFNVKSFTAENEVAIIVEEGEVQLYTESNTGIFIKAGEKGIYDKATKKFSKSDFSNSNALAYKTKKFRFNNAALNEVVQSLNEVYEKPLQLKGTAANCRLTISFENEDIDAISEVIAETLGLQVLKANDKNIIEGNCEN
jgi:ferric-dicitrate binding protein FerR (iron transport regulator)